MYKILLNDYEYRQKQILMENAELKKVLQQMKKEMISLLSPQKKKPRERADDGTGTVSRPPPSNTVSDCCIEQSTPNGNSKEGLIGFMSKGYLVMCSLQFP